MPIRVEVTGQIVAARHVILSSKVQGTLEDIRVREGSVVTKGETLILLDSRDLRASLARADADADNARGHLKRIEELYRRESVAKQDMDNALRAFKIAQAEQRAAAARLSYATIKAPFSGVVTEKYAEIGELAVPGRILLKLEDPKQLRLEAMVAETDLKAVAQGDQVVVQIDALGGASLAATVVQILPTGDPRTHTFLVKIDLPRTPGLRSGMFGRLLIDKGANDTIVAPRSAVIFRGQLTGVFVVGEDRLARLRWVKVGRSFGETVEILSGLNIGESVLTEAARGQDGVTVQIVETVASPGVVP